jgi:ubiquitin C-terminal hydrolase
MGLTCYANATIQCLRALSKVPWIFEKDRYNTLFQKEPSEKRAGQQALTKAFAGVIQLLEQCKEGESVRPAEFWMTLRPAVADTCFEHLAMKAPHDCHEFFLFLLDTIHEATGQKVEMNILRPAPKTEQERHVIQALEAWRSEFSKCYSPFVDLFYGLSHIEVECQSCKNKTHRWETFTSLKGAVPANAGGLGGTGPTLEEMLKAEMEPELIEGYHCDHCAPTRTVAQRTVRLWRLPQVLIIVLKRFTPDGRKIHTRVAPVPSRFEFREFFSTESPERMAVTSYELKGIVDHHGGSNGGHYTSQVCRAGDWTLYDDEGTFKIPSAPVFGDSTYMLFFEREARAAEA